MGPAPQIHSPGSAGDRKAVNWVSPMPFFEPTFGPSAGMWITGTMVRVMMFQSLFTSMGITGWMLRMFWVFRSGPKLRLVLFWKGTLMRLPTGFWASLASSTALSSARAWLAAKVAGGAAVTTRRGFDACISVGPAEGC